MTYEAKKFEHLLGTNGFGDQLLKNHFTLYEGYVANSNKLIDALNFLVKEGNVTALEYAELKRRFGWEFNGMRLHEYYFGNMIKDGTNLSKDSKFFKKIVEDFGVYENWEKDFKSTGMMRGIGWAILYFDSVVNRLFNVWINEHDIGHLSGAKPILIMDVFEHTYMIDYGLKRADYIEAFFKAIDWKTVISRFNNLHL